MDKGAGMVRWVNRCMCALALVFLSTLASARDLPPEVRAAFLLDHDWSSPLPPGTVITAQNLALAESYLDPILAARVRAGDVTITVAAPVPFVPHENYIAATAAHLGEPSLGNAVGILNNYVAGLPFAEPLTADDPRAGEKLAWNIRHAWGGGSGRVDPMIWRYIDMSSGKVERTLKMEAASLLFKHRLMDQRGTELDAGPQEVFRGLYLRVDEPYDIRNTQLLVHRLSDDHARERSWMYLSSQRRVRRLGTGQTTDAFLGSDIMIEDFLGYNGRIVDMEWRYLGRRDVLLPFFVGRRGGEAPGFAGAGGCFPDVSWQVRPAYVLEAVPRNAGHPLSKRLFYVDVQTSTIALGQIYDRSGKLWKLALGAFAHPDHHLPANRGTGVPIFAAVSMIDLQARHCTTITPTSIVGGDVSPRTFTVNHLRARGR
ncbi:MAG: DUF1329 domain-containing protein [Alphaproteobacteria bacterium]|nr:MAG: DUF1329 domain-containing protein [Alphaproteobacteria bacterium]